MIAGRIAAAVLCALALPACSAARGEPSADAPSPCPTPSAADLPADSAQAAVRTLLTEPAARGRQAAAHALARVTALPIRTGAVETLPRRAAHEKDPRDALAIALSDPDSAVRIAAACALALVGDARALPSLEMRARRSTPPLGTVIDWAARRIRERTPALLLSGATLVDGTGSPPLQDSWVLVEGDVITRVGAAGSFAVPPDARVLDLTGRWLTPGLWDVHVHVGKIRDESLPVLVGAGITSVRDMGTDLEYVGEVRRRIFAGELIGPRIVTSGPMLEAPATMERFEGSRTREPYLRTRVPVAGPGDAARLVDSIADLGVDFIKIRETADLDTYRAIAAAARNRGIPLAGHAPFGMDPIEGAGLGLITFEHASYPYPLDTIPEVRTRQLRAFASGGTAFVPTLVAWSTYLMHPDSVAALVADTAARRDPRRALLPEFLIDEWRYELEDRQPLSERALRGWCGFFNQTTRDMATFHAAGIPVLAGTDAASVGLIPGWSLHDELELLVETGVMTAAEAVHAATGSAARYAGRDAFAGTVEPGKGADLVVVDGDPTRDIRALRELRGAVLRGQWLNEARLRDLRQGVPLSTGNGVNLFPSIAAAGCPGLS